MIILNTVMKPVDSTKKKRSASQGFCSVELANAIFVVTVIAVLLYSIYYRNKVASEMTQIITSSFESYGAGANRKLK
jgi:hypothetical protein